MNELILACHLLPFFGMIVIVLFGHTERKIAKISLWATRMMGVSIILLLLTWITEGGLNHEFLWFTLYSRGDYQFPILFYLDRVGAAYLFAIWVIFSVIVRYCRYYLHREAGYKRFFLTIFAFAFGLNLVVLSGSIDLLFAGWEIVGISSFLLIAFYRHRVQPIRNALRAYSVYRYCDIGLLLGALMSRLLFHGSDHFGTLATLFQNDALPPASFIAIVILSLFIIMAACGKSAQFPFCFWLPRAMEGPTPSSAIFYGALSIHLGVFLLLRTAPIWSYYFLTRFVIFGIGLLTVIIASIAEKTQSNIKGQLAYASIAQVGFMFIELAFGLEHLVLLHFLGNAFLRCYQLLVSPSIVTHLMRIEGAADTDFYIENARFQSVLPVSLRDTLPEVLRNTLYVFALQEGNLDLLVRGILWDPLKTLGATINAIAPWRKLAIAVLVFGGLGFAVRLQILDRQYFAIPTALAMALCSVSAFSQKRSVYRIWNAIGLSGALAGVAVWYLRQDAWPDVAVYLTGILPAWFVGVVVLHRLLKNERFAETPFVYRAMAETKPKLSFLLFICFLGLIGFPITPAFLGEDLLLFHASDLHPWIAPIISIAFIVNGIAGASMFLRLCMGRPAEIRV